MGSPPTAYRRLGRLGKAFVDLILPENGCVICGGALEVPATTPPGRGIEVCPDCLDDIFARGAAPAVPPASPAATFLSGIHTAGVYGGVLEKAVLRLKATPDRRLARFLARLIAENLPAEVRSTPAGLVPVPLHPVRRRQRGFNQAELLARALAEILGQPVWDRVCSRVRPTPLQSRLTREDRLLNTVGAFRLTRPLPPARGDHSPLGRHGWGVIVVDDVVTTGATCGEVARLLAGAGAGRIWCAAVARAR